MYKNILLAADGSEHSLRAAENAIWIARCTEESYVEVVYAVDSATSKSDVLHSWDAEGITEKRKERIQRIEKMAKEAGIRYSVKILRGEPGPTIVAHANDNSFDVVVIGSRGLNVLQELVLGSVSHKVAKRANCPVLIVK